MEEGRSIGRVMLFLLIGLVVGVLGTVIFGYTMADVRFGPSTAPGTRTEETPELAPYMARLQRYSQKLGLSIKHRNGSLAAFYQQEVEEVVEEIGATFPSYEGQPAGAMTEAMLLPELRGLQASLQEGHWDAGSAAYRGLIERCNQCHAGTQREFIRIDPAVEANPYNQRFAPATD